MNILYARNRDEMIQHISLLTSSSPATTIVNLRRDGSRTTFHFNPPKGVKWYMDRSDPDEYFRKHIQRLVNKVKRMPQYLFR